jgi:hypothetical protein
VSFLVSFPYLNYRSNPAIRGGLHRGLFGPRFRPSSSILVVFIDNGRDVPDYVREMRAHDLEDRWRAMDEAKKAGGWTNLVPIRCPRCGDVQQWPGHWSRPTCALCYVQDDESARMQWVRAVTEPESLNREPLPEMPPGLRPYEAQVLRAMRRTAAAAARDERTMIWRWLRRQARDEPGLDARALAELVKSGEHLRSP